LRAIFGKKKPEGIRLRAQVSFKAELRDYVRGLGITPLRAGWLLLQAPDRIGATGRTTRDVPIGIQLDIGLQIVLGGRHVPALAFFHGPRRFSRINEAQITYTALGLRRSAGINEIWNGKSRQQTNDRDDDHDFD